LVLQGAHAGDGLELTVKGRDAHVHQVRQFVDVHKLVEIRSQPGNPLRTSERFRF